MAKPLGLTSGEMSVTPGLPTYLSDRTGNRDVFETVIARSGLQFDDSTITRKVIKSDIGSGELSDNTDKVERRRKRERESARRCRARKQNRIQQLEEQKSALEQHNRRLQEQLRNLKESDPVQIRNNLVEKIEKALTKPECNSALQPLLQHYYSISETIANNQICALKAFGGCSDRTDSAAVILWLLFGSEANTVRANAESIRNTFQKEVRPTSDQNNAITKLVSWYQEKIRDVIDTRRIYRELLTRIEQYLDVVKDLDSAAKTFLYNVLNNVFTEVQQAKFTIWLNNKQDLLERLVDAAVTSSPNVG